MPTLTVDNRSNGFSIQWYENKKRKSIFLSGRQYRQKTAETLKEMVETLVYYQRNGITIPDKSTERLLVLATPEIQAKLAKVGLISIAKSKTCRELWNSFIKQRMPVVKPSSLKLYQRSQEIFFESFSVKDSLDRISVDDLLEWKSALLARFAPASVAGYIGVTKMVFDWAVNQDWLTKNPMKNIPAGSFRNRSKDRTITLAEYAKLLEACPSQEWRVIIALARIGGLRCPSELKQLRWTDVDWEGNRFTVKSPKTERHEGRGERLVPLFPELRTELERLFSGSESEFVVNGFRKTSWNLGVVFSKIAERAGLETIVRPFDNMRMSRSKEVFDRWGQAKESLWIGHSAKVMQNHYFCLSDDDFAKAAAG